MTMERADNPRTRKRLAGEPWQIAGALYLASDEADHVTGQSFTIDGGLELYWGSGCVRLCPTCKLMSGRNIPPCRKLLARDHRSSRVASATKFKTIVGKIFSVDPSGSLRGLAPGSSHDCIGH